ncbi:MAG: hypothetical protein IH831_04740, partial [Planctomycetes bacterium]|nr:hypothetical protein [Planctomycetota bacterium]
LHVESFGIMRHVALVASGEKQDLAGWRKLARELFQRLEPLRVAPNPRALGIVLLAIALMSASIAHMLAHPQLVAQAVEEIFSY